MELGLRLGTGAPFGFHHEKPPQDHQPTVSHTGLDFCLSFPIPPLQLQQHDDEEHNHDPIKELDDQNPNNNLVVGRLFDTPPPLSHLHFLPATPPTSQTDISEAGGGFRDGNSGAPPSAMAEAAEGWGFEMEEGNRSWERGSDEDENNEDENMGSKKKLRLSREQSAFLEQSFKQHHSLYPKQKIELARRLKLRPRQVEVWFQNRRARTKLKQTEVDCEYLKKCCETLTQENKKLQKELQDLRALKTTDSLYMHYLPPTTLTMCPSCQRAAADKHPIISNSSPFFSL